MRVYEYKHVVGFEETNMLGNVYFTNFFRWQGMCREMFLRDHAPSVMKDLQRDLYLVTSKSSCEFFAEAFAFDEVVVRMSLLQLSQSRITMGFDYVRSGGGREELLARGEQQVVCMRRRNGQTQATEIPDHLLRALKAYQSG